MKTTIEEKNSKKYTIVWNETHPDFNPFIANNYDEEIELGRGSLALLLLGECIAIALPALPRNPKPEDARLLWRYMSEGIEPRGCALHGYQQTKIEVSALIVDCREITHATDSEGNRVEIAIEG